MTGKKGFKTTWGRVGVFVLLGFLLVFLNGSFLLAARPGGGDGSSGQGKINKGSRSRVRPAGVSTPSAFLNLQITDDSVDDGQGQPTIAVDSNGYLHVVYVDESVTSSPELFYTMFDKLGNIRIAPTRITDDDDQYSVRPFIAVDSNDCVHVVWHDWRDDDVNTENLVYYQKLDPSLDDQSGDAANPATITVEDDKAVSQDLNGVREFAPRIAVDSADNVHLVYIEDNEDPWYGKLDNDGDLIGSWVDLGDVVGYHGQIDIDVDSANNAHVVAMDDWDFVYYSMVSSSGTILIDQTEVADDNPCCLVRPSVAVGPDNMVHITWHDDGDYATHYTKINPALDDQSGDAADDDVIEVIGDVTVEADDSDHANMSWVTVDENNNAAVTWCNPYDNNYNVKVYSPTGAVLVAKKNITNGNVDKWGGTGMWSYGYSVLDSNNLLHFAWLDDRDGDDEIFYAPVDYYTPENGSVKVNNDAAATNSVNVTLTLSATDNDGVSQMMVSNDAAFTGAVWEAYATTKAWVLSAGDGVKTVYVKFRDRTGNESAAVNDAISIDTTPPAINSINLTDGQNVKGTFNIEIGATDNILMDKVDFYIDGVLKATDTTNVYSYAWDTTKYSTGAHTVRITAYDAAGNSTTISRSVNVRNLPYTDGTALIYLFGAGLAALGTGLTVRRKALA